jgi:hypothetical protein
MWRHSVRRYVICIDSLVDNLHLFGVDNIKASCGCQDYIEYWYYLLWYFFVWEGCDWRQRSSLLIRVRAPLALYAPSSSMSVYMELNSSSKNKM